MSGASLPPDWRRPPGVNAALWDYAHAEHLATSEDDYFARHPLFEADSKALAERFVTPAPLLDLGCGAGRHALAFARRGFPVVAVDLSHAMLREVGRKAERESLTLGLVNANLCDLRCFPERTFGYALSMFSTLGMIRGASPRRRALREAARCLRPGGRLALHAHNFWLNLKDPQGRRWIVEQGWKSMMRRDDAGDRRMTYRGIPNLEVHLYRWRELRRDLEHAGLVIDEVLPIDRETARLIPMPWLAPGFRAGGWLVFARRANP